MSPTASTGAQSAADPGELERFRKIQRLTNHWAHPAGPASYYWYLTFENAPGLHAIARKCQEAIAFPYYDLTPLDDLHLTLDRIAFTADITPGQVKAIEDAAARSCQRIPPLGITIGLLGGTPGAIGFTATPSQPIRHLRDALRAATLAVRPGVPVSETGFHPHVTIAYSNSDDIPATDVITAVEKVRTANRAEVTIREASIVVLERGPRSYAWRAISRIPLAG